MHVLKITYPCADPYKESIMASPACWRVFSYHDSLNTAHHIHTHHSFVASQPFTICKHKFQTYTWQIAIPYLLHTTQQVATC